MRVDPLICIVRLSVAEAHRMQPLLLSVLQLALPLRQPALHRLVLLARAPERRVLPLQLAQLWGCTREPAPQARAGVSARSRRDWQAHLCRGHSHALRRLLRRCRQGVVRLPLLKRLPRLPHRGLLICHTLLQPPALVRQAVHGIQVISFQLPTLIQLALQPAQRM